MKNALAAIVLIAVLFSGGNTQEYTFDIPEVEDEADRLAWSGNFDAKYYIFHLNDNSPFYKLSFAGNDSISDYLSQYRLDLYLDGDYQTKKIGFHIKTHTNYFDDTKDVDQTIFEVYGNVNLSLNSFIQAGKRMYNWGTGYAFNPVGYVNPVKDPENPELTQAGVSSLSYEKIKSFAGVLKTYAFTGIVIPPAESINDKFGELKNTDIAINNYFLLWDMDIDIAGYYSRVRPKQLGIDFAVNLRENIEIHGELSYAKDEVRYKIRNNDIWSERKNGYSCLFGGRCLNSGGTTIIGEYYHNDSGLAEGEFESYSRFLSESAGDPEGVEKAQRLSKLYFKGSNLMQDYLYLKMQHPEPFGLLYFTPSFFSIFNVNDRSYSVSASFSYKPVTNLELILWYTLAVGEDNTEYGGKQSKQKLQAWMRVYF